MAYLIYNLTLQGSTPDTYEQIGSKPKFWFLEDGDDSKRSLFKFARPGTGEAWAEKAAAEIAHVLGLPRAVIELATFNKKPGTISPSFVDKKKGEDLLHGNEILSGRDATYDRSKIRGQHEHRLDSICESISSLVEPDRRDAASGLFAGYMVLDALIGNTDRHHENWGLIRRTGPDGTTRHDMAPTYDHASSLGRELLDDRRQELMSNKRVEEYVRKGRGGIFLVGTGRKGENPLELVEKAFVGRETLFSPWLDRLKRLENREITDIIEQLPDEWMSPIAKLFCAEFMATSRSALGRLLK